ncbi:MAG TPA: hypothetical protein VIY09_00280 [Rhizomicrobium sp.]
MYAAHFAAALAIKSRAPKAPAWALLGGAFVPDFLWIGFAAAGVEPADPKIYFDDWSHSLLSIVIEATLFALLFYRRGAAVWLPVWLGVFSHFLLDLPIHPRPLALYPHASLHLGWNMWSWGLSKSFLGATNYWWVQLAVTLVLLAIYARGARRIRIAPNLAAASCVAVLGLHLLF